MKLGYNEHSAVKKIFNQICHLITQINAVTPHPDHDKQKLVPSYSL